VNAFAVAAGADAAVGHVLLVRSAGRTARVAAARVAGELRRHHVSVSEIDHSDLDRVRSGPGSCLAVLAIGRVGSAAIELAVALDVVLCPLSVSDGPPVWFLRPSLQAPAGEDRPVAQIGCDGTRSVTVEPVTVAAPGGFRLVCSAFPGAVDDLEIVPAGPDRLRVSSAGGETTCSAIAVDSAAPMAVTFSDRTHTCQHLVVRAHHRPLRWAAHQQPRS
jgi:hypothetical protein